MTQPLPHSELVSPPDSRKKPISHRGVHFLCRLGQGGMAEVHLANAAPPGAPPDLVVVKRMHQQHADDPASLRMLLDEARLAMSLVHPNIVRTERLSLFDGRQGIVMEYLDGQPFQHVLKRAYQKEGTLSIELVVQIAIAALDGLHYAHELKATDGRSLSVVHRDVSPHNLFITYDGAVKLLDFGIAKNALQDGRTRTGLLKGKVSYMAPEQARGEALDRRADIWSLGVVLWEAVTGIRLFKGANEAATLNMTLTNDVAPPSSRRSDLAPELEAILMRALQRDPADRYGTAAEMRDELEAWLSNRDFSPGATVSQLMLRLFGREMWEQRVQIQGLLRGQTKPSAESSVTLIAPQFGATGTLSGMRAATQLSSVTDLMQELTRQRRVTTRLLGGLTLLVGGVVLAALYLLLQRPLAVGATAAVPLAGRSMPAAAPRAALGPALAVPPAAPEGGKSPAQPGDVGVHSPVPAPKPALAALPSTPRKPRPSGPAREADLSDAYALQPATPAPALAVPIETGRLNLDTTPWSIVSVGGKVLGQTPIIGATLPVGTHTLSLSNPEQGLRTTYQVTISAGRVTARRIGLDQ